MSYPRHVAIIMDGNGRWATERGLSRLKGHKAGMQSLHRIIRHASHRGLEWLTVFAFSSENWSRPASEINHLMELLKLFIKRDLAELHKNNVRIKIIGTRDAVPSNIAKLLSEAENMTARNTGLNLVVAFNYGGRNELINAMKSIARKVQNQQINIDDIDENSVNNVLFTSNIPDPDLLIRTSGEQRLSNFLLWQSAYSELYFSSYYWPDFDEKAFDLAINDYLGRERRFGAVPVITKKQKAQ